MPKGVLLVRNPNGLYPVAENTRHPRTPVILCSFFFFLWLKYNVETLLFLAFPAPAAPFTELLDAFTLCQQNRKKKKN